MITKEDIKLINPQEPMAQIQPYFTDTPSKDIGRTNRPINQKTQVTNVYLDGVIAKKTSQTIPDVTGTDVTGYTFTKTGTYPFENTNSIIIPIDGTYIIFANFGWSDTLTAGLHTITINGIQTLTQYLENISPFQTVQITSVLNLSKGDIIGAHVLQESGASKYLKISISLTKIS